MSATSTPEIMVPKTPSILPLESAALEAVPVQESLRASVVAREIVVPANARPAPKRRSKAAANPQTEIEQLREALEQERRLHAIQRATAEQARRVADCLSIYQETLLTHCTQPCFTLDVSGLVREWNPAMAHWTSHTASEVLGARLADLVGDETGEPLERACRLALATIESATGEERGRAFSLPGPFAFAEGVAARLTLIPRCRIPGCVETFLVLVTPEKT